MPRYDVARSTRTGLYWGGPIVDRSFRCPTAREAVAFGDAHTDHAVLLDQEEGYTWESVAYDPETGLPLDDE